MATSKGVWLGDLVQTSNGFFPFKVFVQIGSWLSVGLMDDFLLHSFVIIWGFFSLFWVGC